jgi:hypothetical protein
VCVSDRMAATGTVTLSEIKSTRPAAWTDVHIYTKRYTQDFGQRRYFDTSLFYNTEEFTMSYNEQHKMLMEGYSFDRADSTVYHACLVNGKLSIDLQHEPGQLCYAITLLTPDVTITVGPKTSLSLLLQTGQFHVTTYMVTEDLATQLKQPRHECDSGQVNTVRQAAENKTSSLFHGCSRDPRKRKFPFDISEGPCVPYRPCSPTSTPPPSI